LVGARVLGIDVGRRRIGLAISDRTRTLARPLGVLQVRGRDAVELMVKEIARLGAEEDGLALVVVGMPARLDGSPDEQTTYVAGVVRALRARSSVPVVETDERLTSREAESRLAAREPDWRTRKTRLDAVAAAILLQDYLDGPGRAR
jgi:putative Holliday junction resolvase